MLMEEYAYVLDFLPEGRPFDRVKEPTAYVMGANYFALLEVSIKPNVRLNLKDKVVVGKTGRDVVLRIKRRIGYDDLTSTAKSVIEEVIPTIVKDNEKKFVDFMNRCGPLTLRQHQLELLPGLGKKHMWEVLKERKGKPFESFQDLKSRHHEGSLKMVMPSGELRFPQLRVKAEDFKFPENWGNTFHR